MPEGLETEIAHFLKGLLCGPVIDGHTINGEEHAGAIAAKPAVHQDFFPGPLLREGQKFHEILVLGSRPAASADIHDAHAECLGFFAFGFCQAFSFAAQVDDQGDAKFFEFAQTFVVGLRTAIKLIVQLSDIRHSAKMPCLRVRWMRCVRRVGAGILCKSFCGGERKKQHNERENRSKQHK
jgi:hypothetical protein